MEIKKLDHYNLGTVYSEETLYFYTQVLGLEKSELRPQNIVGVSGAWIAVAGHPAIHINFIEHDKAAPTGAIDHLAFEAKGWREFEARFQELGVEYKKIITVESNLCQLYVWDPNQIKIEMSFRGEL